METQEEKKAALLLIIGNAIYGFNGVFTRLGQQWASPLALLSFRFAFSLLILALPVLTGRVRIRLRGGHFLSLLLLLLIEPVYYFFESFSIKYTNATYTGLALALSPVSSALLAALFLHELPSRREAFFCMFPVAGASLMALVGGQLGILTPKGLFCLAGVCLSTAGIRLFSKSSSRYYSPYERTFAIILVCFLYFTMKALQEAHMDLGRLLAPLHEPRFLPVLAFLVLFCSLGSNMLGNYATAKLSVVRYTTLNSVSVLFSLFSGVVFLKEPLTPVSFAGAVLTLIGVVGIGHAKSALIKKAGPAQQAGNAKIV